MDLLAAHAGHQLVERQGLGHRERLAGDVAERLRRFLGDEEVLDVDQADELVQIALAEREAGVAAPACAVEVGVHRGRGVEVDDLGAGNHHLAGVAVGELEHVVEQLPLGLGEFRLLLGGEETPDLLLAVREFAVPERFDAEQAQEGVRHLVQDPDAGVGHLVEEPQRRRHPQAGRFGPADGERLGRQFAEHDVEHADDREGDHQADRVGGLGRQAGHQVEERLQQSVDRWFADDAKADAGEGDAELSRRQVGVELIDHALRQTAPQRVLVGRHLGRPDLDQGELGGDEEAVQADQEQGQGQAPAQRQVEIHGRPGGRDDRRDHSRAGRGVVVSGRRDPRSQARWSGSGSGSSRLESDGEGSGASSFTPA